MKSIRLFPKCRITAWLRKGASSFLVLAALSACQDEILQDRNSLAADGRLHFNVQTVSADWKPLAATRSRQSKGNPAALKAEEEIMYLHPSVAATVGGTKTQEVQTRGVQTSSFNDFHNEISLFGYVYPQDAWDPNSSTPNFMYDVLLSREAAGELYATPNEYFLPTAGASVRFYAYAPRGAKGVELPASTQTGAPRFRYTVPTYSSEQVDLCFADAAFPETSGEVPLAFHHGLTAIQFKTSTTITDAIVIEQIYIKGVAKSATHQCDAQMTATAEWSEYSGTDDFAVQNYSESGNLNKKMLAVTEQNVLDDDELFFMLPQTFSDTSDAKIEIAYRPRDGADIQTLTFSLQDQSWAAGTTVTYVLSRTEDHYELQICNTSDKEISSLESPHGGTTLQVHIKSLLNGSKNTTNYSLQFSTDGGLTWVDNTNDAKPNMIGTTPKEDNDGDGIWNHTITITHAPSYVRGDVGTDTYTLQHADWVTNHGLVDTETANCYIVSQPGQHRFRATYGNAIVNNRPNAAVLTGAYVNGANDPITEENMNLKDFDARLIWEDTEGLVQVEKVEEGADMWRIYIIVGGSPSTYSNVMRPGNALIGAYRKSDGVLLWSWHIWVTPDPGTGSVNGKTFMKDPVGYVEGGWTVGATRSCLMRAYIPGDDGTAANPKAVSNWVTINQTDAGFTSTNLPGRYPTYQWGRKEPLWPTATLSNGNYTSVLFGPGVPTNGQPQAAGLTGPADRIKNPLTFRNGEGTISPHLWNANAVGQEGGTETSGNVSKSMYDPCPPNFHVPNATAFQSYLRTGWTYEWANTLGGVQGGYVTTNNSSGSGAFFSLSVNNAQLFMPFGGYRYYEENFRFLNNIRSAFYGGSWTAGRQRALDGSGVISVVAHVQYTPVNTMFWPRYGVGSSATGDASATVLADYRNAWPVIPQSGN